MHTILFDVEHDNEAIVSQFEDFLEAKKLADPDGFQYLLEEMVEVISEFKEESVAT